jgi:hypothetical protein
MSPIPRSTFQVRRDQVSYQVSCDEDAKFWFRMESAEDHDNITDFSLGAFDHSVGGDLLVLCYSKIAKTPSRRIVFGDFLSSKPSDPSAIEAAKAHLEGYAKTLLAAYGQSMHASHVLRRREKLDLMIVA